MDDKHPLIQHMSGRLHSELTTDELMALLRGDEDDDEDVRRIVDKLGGCGTNSQDVPTEP